jgi:hypothetical protein
MMYPTIEWLLTASPWVEYRTRRDILDEPETNPTVIACRKRMVEHAAIRQLISEVSNWPGSLLISHKSAGHSIHKLVFLAELGLNAKDEGMDVLISRVMEHQDVDGPFQMLTNLSPNFGGNGEDFWGWGLCDAPLLLYALVKFGLGNDAGVKKGIEKVTSLVRENGWPCAGSTQYGTFRGPGRKIDPCPIANLFMLQLLATVPEYHDSEACHLGVESQLHCWAERLTFHPYIFYMGNDFCKLKAPLVWYDLLHVTNVLSQFAWARNDERYQEMTSILAAKADAEGRFTPESIWNAWKEWDFGQKKVPSPWLTYLARKILAD